MSKDHVIVVDGANVAYEELSKKGEPKVSNINAVRNALKEHGFTPIIIIDASLRFDIDDPDQMETLIDDQEFRQVPAETDADFFVLETADRYGALVVSNDRFEPYRDRYPWIEERRVPVMIINGKVELYQPKLNTE